MSSDFSIPALMIQHKLFHDPSIKTVKQLAQAIAGAPDQNLLTVLNAEPSTVQDLWEMARVNVMIHRDSALTHLYTSWLALGYTNTVPHVLLHCHTNTRPLNIKMSMFMRTECFGTWALIPEEIWDIAKVSA